MDIMKSILYISVFITMIALCSSCGAKTGNMAPDFEATLIDGSNIQLSDYQGDYVLLDFWGSWCAPCRRENPALVKIYKKFENQESAEGERFKILSVALEKIEGQAEAAIKRDNLYWPDHVISMSRIVLASPIARAYGIAEVPSKFLINPQGEIILSNPSIVDLERELEDRLK